VQERPNVQAPLQAVLFDLDGTLIDSYDAITASVNHVRGLHNLPPLSEPEVRTKVGRGAIRLMVDTVGVGDPQANVNEYLAHHPSVLRSGTRLLPGVIETLTYLHGKKYRLGVCSNKPVAFSRELLTFLGLEPLLDLVIGPEDVARPKPAPDMILAALTRLGLAPGDALYIGDMVVDIETARAAGVTVFVVPTGSETIERLDAAKPDRRLSGLRDLIDLL
jgi:2-phosphoglycolate phosphatase